jgi:two-component system sensor histidine kinase/response regulator
VLVEWVEDGTLVLEKFETAPENYYDAVLLDIRMPKLDGLATARYLRALDRKDVAAAAHRGPDGQRF